MLRGSCVMVGGVLRAQNCWRRKEQCRGFGHPFIVFIPLGQVCVFTCLLCSVVLFSSSLKCLCLPWQASLCQIPCRPVPCTVCGLFLGVPPPSRAPLGAVCLSNPPFCVPAYCASSVTCQAVGQTASGKLRISGLGDSLSPFLKILNFLNGTGLFFTSDFRPAHLNVVVAGKSASVRQHQAEERPLAFP